MKKLKVKKQKLNLQNGDVVLNLTGIEYLPVAEQHELRVLIGKIHNKKCFKILRLTAKEKIELC